MKLIIGLGNPDKKYANTRHNIGFMIVDAFAKNNHLTFKLESKFQALIAYGEISGQKVILAKPLTYMNLSGISVSKILNYYQLEHQDMIVISDDVSLNVGALRLRTHGGHGGHNGLKNIIEHLSGNDFKRIRIGIGSNDRIPLEIYVLQLFSKTESATLEPIISKTTDALEAWVSGKDFELIMTQYNTKA